MIIARIKKSIRHWWKDTKKDIEWYGYVYALTPEWFKKFRRYIVDTYFRKFNVIKIRSLDAHWHDRVEVLLHANFQILVDFVEKEWKGNYTKSLHYLDIEAQEKIMRAQNGDEKFIAEELESYRKQNQTIKEIWDLYVWWIQIYPSRKFPDFEHPDYEIFSFVGIGEPDEFGDYEYYTMDDSKRDPIIKEKWDKYIENYGKQEDAWEKEDDEMLAKLIKIRRHLWT